MLHTLSRHSREHATHNNNTTYANTSPTPPTLARYPCHPRKHATHTTHASTNNTSFLKLVLNVSSSKNLSFRNFDLFFWLKKIFVKMMGMYMHIIMNITVYNSTYIWIYLSNAKLCM